MTEHLQNTPTIAECPIFSDAYGTFFRIDHKKCLNTFEIINSKSVSQLHKIKSEINNRKTFGKSPNTWKLNNKFLNNPQNEEGNHNQKTCGTEQNKNITYQNVSDATKAVFRGKYIAFNEYIRKEKKTSNQ